MRRILMMVAIAHSAIVLTACGQGSQLTTTVTVVSDNGTPIEGAHVHIGYPSHIPSRIRGESARGLTDGNGAFTFTGTASWTASAAVTKEGYYRSVYSPQITEPDERGYAQVKPEIDVTLTLREICNPVPMYARNIKLRMPMVNEYIAFDLFENEWVAPFGSGSQEHFRIRVSGTIEDENYDYRIELDFSNPHDGIIKVEPAEGGSAFVWPHEAPVTGYLRHVELQQTRPDSVAFESQDPIVINGHLDHLWIIRFNTEVDEDGSVINANYAKIRGRLLLHGVRSAPESPGLSLIDGLLYVNPIVNERSLEFDTNRNLSQERVFPPGWVHP